MILSDKPKRNQAVEPVKPAPTVPQARFEFVCYFLKNQQGPPGFGPCTLLSFNFDWQLTGFSEELRRYILPKGSFIFNQDAHQFYLKPEVEELARSLATTTYRYKVIG